MLFLARRPQAHSHINIVIGLLGELLHGRKPHGADAAAELCIEEAAHEGLLFLVQLRLLEQEDVFLSQQARHLADGCLVFHHIFRIQFIDAAYQLLCLLALTAQRVVFAFGDAAQSGHTHPKELVQVVGINSEERESLQQGYAWLLRLL